MEEPINTPNGEQGNNPNIVMPSPQASGLDNGQQGDDDSLDDILQKVEAEEIQEIRAEIGEEAYVKIAKNAEAQAVANFLKGVNEETGRNYKDIADVAKSIKEGAKFFQEAKALEQKLQELQGGAVQPQAQQPQQALGTDQNPLPQQGTGIPQGTEVNNTPATQQQVQPNGVIDPNLMETRADLLEIKVPEFAKVRNEVLRVARQNNVMPDVVFNGEGLFADYDFKNRAKSLAQENSNNVMSSTANDAGQGGGITTKQIMQNASKMSAKEIARGLRIAK